MLYNIIRLWWGRERMIYADRRRRCAADRPSVRPVTGRLVSLLSAVYAPDEDVHTVTRRTLRSRQPATSGQIVETTASQTPAQPPRITAANVRANRGCGGGGCSIAMPSLHQAALLVLMLLTATRDGLAAPDITMSIHGDLAGSGTPSSFTVNQVGSC